MREFIDISLQESIAERTHSVGWENLTEAERQVFCVYLLHAYLLQNGLQLALTELGGKGMSRAFEGLSRIGAKEAASLVAKIVNDFNQVDRTKLELEFARSELGVIRFDLPQEYATKHPEEFPGPRSLVELWNSMQMRGISEKPERLIKFERLAEADAHTTDRRCRTCGQPVPAYKSNCRRCGRAYIEASTAGTS
jgi:hypothetical protein